VGLGPSPKKLATVAVRDDVAYEELVYDDRSMEEYVDS
jgi:hypothetical protein